MEFALTLLFLLVYMVLALATRRYTVRIRLALVLMAVFGPVWYFIIWR